MSEKICAVTGSFDPITVGHLDIIRKAAGQFDKVVVLMLINEEKQYFFSVEERLELIRIATRDMDNVEAVFYDGITADYCLPRGIKYLVRGIRDGSDGIYEARLAKLNEEMGLTTLFFRANGTHRGVSSTDAKEKMSESDFSELPTAVAEKVREYLEKRKKSGKNE